MSKYRFRLSETNWIEFTQKDLDGFRDVNSEECVEQEEE